MGGGTGGRKGKGGIDEAESKEMGGVIGGMERGEDVRDET